MASLNNSHLPPVYQQHLLNSPDSTHIAQATGTTGSRVHCVPRKPIPSATEYQTVPMNDFPSLKETNESQDSVKAQSYKNLSPISVWWQELVACILVITAFAAIVITLLLVNNKTLPTLPFHVSVNTLIAIFAAVLKLAAAFVLTEGLSQSKWSWYMRPRRLHDFQIYDNASRGPWGALQLLWYLRCRPLAASLGAFVTIATTLVDPLSQELIKIYDCTETLPNQTTALPRTNLYDELGGHVAAGYNQLPTAFIATMSTGQFSSVPPQVPFNCPTGNCTFENDYSSVGYYAKCTDMSDSIVFDGNRTKYHDLVIRLTAPQADLEDLLSFNVSGVSDGMDEQGLTRFALNYYDATVNMLWWDANIFSENFAQAHAVRCSLEPCVHTFRAKVVNGILSEQILQRGPVFPWATGPNPDHYNDWYYSMADLSCIDDTAQESLRDIGYSFTAGARWLPYNVSVNAMVQESDTRRYWGLFPNGTSLSDTDLRTVPSQCIYQMLCTVDISLGILYLDQYFNGSVQDTMYEIGVTGPLVATALYNTWAIDKNQNGTFENVQSMMQDITDSMTTYIRWHGNSNMSEPAPGNVQRNTVCVKVRWAYIASSASIVILLLLFFVSTVFHTRITERSSPISVQPDGPQEARSAGHHNFKSSALATIFHGLDERSLDQPGRVGLLNTVSELEAFSKERLVTLVMTEHGWKLSAVQSDGVIAFRYCQ